MSAYTVDRRVKYFRKFISTKALPTVLYSMFFVLSHSFSNLSSGLTTPELCRPVFSPEYRLALIVSVPYGFFIRKVLVPADTWGMTFLASSKIVVASYGFFCLEA